MGQVGKDSPLLSNSNWGWEILSSEKTTYTSHNLGIQGRKEYEDLADGGEEGGEGDDDVFTTTLRKLGAHFKDKINVVLERHKFFKREQGKNEKVISYIAALRGLAATCEFGVITDSLIRDQLVRCTNDHKVQGRLLTQNPDLEETVTIAKSIEHTAYCFKEMKTSKGVSQDDKQINVIKGDDEVLKVSGTHAIVKSKTKRENLKCYRCVIVVTLQTSPDAQPEELNVENAQELVTFPRCATCERLKVKFMWYMMKEWRGQMTTDLSSKYMTKSQKRVSIILCARYC